MAGFFLPIRLDIIQPEKQFHHAYLYVIRVNGMHYSERIVWCCYLKFMGEQPANHIHFSLMLPVMARESDDKALMVRYRKGGVGAFETLYARHKGPLYRYFLRQGLETESSAELMQEVWMKVIGAKDRYEPTAKFTTYLYRLAHHCLIDRSRRSAHKMATKPAAQPDHREAALRIVTEYVAAADWVPAMKRRKVESVSGTFAGDQGAPAGVEQKFREDPESFLHEIERLNAAGSTAEAGVLLNEFLAQYPDHAVSVKIRQQGY